MGVISESFFALSTLRILLRSSSNFRSMELRPMDKNDTNEAIAKLGRRLFGVGPPRHFDAWPETHGRTCADYDKLLSDLVYRTAPLPIGTRLNDRLCV